MLHIGSANRGRRQTGKITLKKKGIKVQFCFSFHFNYFTVILTDFSTVIQNTQFFRYIYRLYLQHLLHLCRTFTCHWVFLWCDTVHVYHCSPVVFVLCCDSVILWKHLYWAMVILDSLNRSPWFTEWFAGSLWTSLAVASTSIWKHKICKCQKCVIQPFEPVFLNSSHPVYLSYGEPIPYSTFHAILKAK